MEENKDVYAEKWHSLEKYDDKIVLKVGEMFSVEMKKPTSAYNLFSSLFEMKKYPNEDLPQEDKDVIEHTYSCAIMVAEAIMFSASDDKLFFGLGEYIAKYLNELQEKEPKEPSGEEKVSAEMEGILNGE